MGGSDELRQQCTGHDQPTWQGIQSCCWQQQSCRVGFTTITPSLVFSTVNRASNVQEFKQPQLKTTQLFNICHYDWIHQQYLKLPTPRWMFLKMLELHHLQCNYTNMKRTEPTRGFMLYHNSSRYSLAPQRFCIRS